MAHSDLAGRLALVTGATGGIGRATSLALARLDISIAIHYNSDEEGAEFLRKMVLDILSGFSSSDDGGVEERVHVFQADLSSYDQVRKLYADIVDKFGGRSPSILFNNAGATMGKSGVKDIGEVTIDEFERTWRMNCGGAFLLTQLCMPAMVEDEFGRVVFCSSVAGFTGGGVGPHYASSKSALHGLIHWLATAYAKKGITINGVAPALIEDTKMLSDAVVDQLVSKIPVGRLGRPEEVSETVVWLVKTGYMTNKVIGVDGGLFIQ